MFNLFLNVFTALKGLSSLKLELCFTIAFLTFVLFIIIPELFIEKNQSHIQ